MPSSLHRRIGQLALVGFDGFTIPPEVRSLAREFDLGGVILFKRNVESPGAGGRGGLGGAAAERAICRSGSAWTRRAGAWRGCAARSPSGRRRSRSAARGATTLAERFARALAAELAAVGISIDFAPVLDVLTNPKNPVIGDRALAEHAGTVGAGSAR